MRPSLGSDGAETPQPLQPVVSKREKIAQSSATPQCRITNPFGLIIKALQLARSSKASRILHFL